MRERGMRERGMRERERESSKKKQSQNKAVQANSFPSSFEERIKLEDIITTSTY